MIPDLDIDTLWQLLADADWRLERLLVYLKANLHEPLSLASAAALCRLEMTYFSRYFRTSTGLNFTDWYRWIRIARAGALLAEPRLTIDAVCQAVGYKHITTFERAFRKCTGLCPAEYRRRFAPRSGAEHKKRLQVHKKRLLLHKKR